MDEYLHMQKKHNYCIDVAKAICIILVVIGHYYPSDSPDWYANMRKCIYMFHMPLFMFASGYLYAYVDSNDGYLTFLAKKFKRLIIPYFFVSTVIISIKLLSESFSSAAVENPVTFMSYVEMLYGPSAGYFLWFIWALWWMFVIIPFFKTTKQRCFIALVGLVLYFAPSFMPETFCLRQFSTMMIWFALGTLSVRYIPDIQMFMGGGLASFYFVLA